MLIIKDSLGRYRLKRGASVHATSYPTRAKAQAGLERILKGFAKWQCLGAFEQNKKVCTLD